MAVEIFHDQISSKECAGPGIEPVNAWLPGGHASDRASGPGYGWCGFCGYMMDVLLMMWLFGGCVVEVLWIMWIFYG